MRVCVQEGAKVRANQASNNCRSLLIGILIPARTGLCSLLLVPSFSEFLLQQPLIVVPPPPGFQQTVVKRSVCHGEERR
jgi:hypothetical protein